MALAGCQDKSPPALKPLDFTQSRDVADAIANDLVQGDTQDIYKRLDMGFQTIVKNEKDVKAVIERMCAESGPPVECVFKISQAGIRKDGVWQRPSRTFWYSVRTKKFEKGKYFLKVEVVPAFSSGILNTSGFGILSFKADVPEYLK
jgi:hypothetical protein